MAVPDHFAALFTLGASRDDRLADGDLFVPENIRAAGRERFEVFIDRLRRGQVAVLASLRFDELLLLPLGVEQGDAHVLLHLIHPHLLPGQGINRKLCA